MKRIETKRGYDLSAVVSTVQKAIRRGDKKVAGYFALEMFESGYGRYCWRRVLTVAAEDVETWVMTELASLHYAFEVINKGKKASEFRGRIFLTKAVFILCEAMKSRETDHFQNFGYDRKVGITDEEIDAALAEGRSERLELPEWCFDVHTWKGRQMGKTKADFFLEEQECLIPMGDDQFLSMMLSYIDGIK